MDKVLEMYGKPDLYDNLLEWEHDILEANNYEKVYMFNFGTFSSMRLAGYKSCNPIMWIGELKGLLRDLTDEQMEKLLKKRGMTIEELKDIWHYEEDG